MLKIRHRENQWRDVIDNVVMKCIIEVAKYWRKVAGVMARRAENKRSAAYQRKNIKNLKYVTFSPVDLRPALLCESDSQ